MSHVTSDTRFKRSLQSHFIVTVLSINPGGHGRRVMFTVTESSRKMLP